MFHFLRNLFRSGPTPTTSANPLSFPPQSLAYLELIADSLPVLISYIDADKRYRFVSTAYETWFGYRRAEVIGKSVTEVLGPRAAKALEPMMDAALSGRRTTFEMEVPYREGGGRYIAGTYVPDTDDRNQVIGFAVLVEDITARKRAEAEHAARELRLSAIVENSPSALSVKDPQGRYLIANPNFDRILGISSASMIGKTDSEIFPPHVAQVLMESDAKVIGSRRLLSVEETIPGQDGKLHRFLAHKFPIFDPNGNIDSVCSISLDVTAKKQIEAERESLLEREKLTRKAIETSEQRLRQFVEQSPYAVAMMDKEMRYLFVSRKWLTDFRLNISDVRGKSHYELFPEIPERWKEAHRRCLAGAAEKSDEEAFIRADGRVDWIRWEIRPWRDESNQVGGVLIFTEDISTRKHAEFEGARLAALVRSSSDAIISKDTRGIVTSWNEAATRIFGYDASEMIGKSITVLIPENMRHEEEQILSEIEKRNPLEHYETQRRTKSGRIIDVSLSVSPILDRAGRVVGVSKIARDITDRKRAEEALRKSEESFRQLADAMPQIVWTSRPDGHMDYYNQRWYDFTGFDREMRGDPSWLSLLSEEDQHRCRETWYESVNTGKPFQIEYRFWDRKTETYRWFMGRALPIRDADGKIVKWFGTSTDIDDLKRTQELLGQAIRVRDDFLSIASHELKTPLTSLKLQMQMFKRWGAGNLESKLPPEKLERILDISTVQVNRLQTLIDDLLDVSKIAAGKLQFTFEEVDLAAVLQEITERHNEGLLTGESVTLELPPERVTARCDRFRIEQVVTNLLTNAVKYGDGKPVSVRLEAGPGSARVLVRDLGIGIPKEKQEKIFERYERAIDSTNITGLGLGLYISREIMQAHSGRIHVESEPGRGSTFIVDLPYHATPAQGLTVELFEEKKKHSLQH